MWSQYEGVQASVTLNDEGAVLLELHASYSAKEREITCPVKNPVCPFTRFKLSLNDNLIVLLKPDIDLDISRSSIQNAVSE